MKQIPLDCIPYKQTPVFTEATVPAGLLKSHKTKTGVWGKIVVTEGRLTYRILEPIIETHELSPSQAGVVEPAVKHEVATDGPVKFYVEFLTCA
ncbi:MAG: tellurite resistance-related uncharacterized protein [Candidatus Azotimanducaceae bacterium]|jgi:tellurite resistance-related uncharacterized protein